MCCLRSDLRALCAESRKKYPDLRESSERAILKLRNQSKTLRRAVEEKDPNANELILQTLRWGTYAMCTLYGDRGEGATDSSDPH